MTHAIALIVENIGGQHYIRFLLTSGSSNQLAVDEKKISEGNQSSGPQSLNSVIITKDSRRGRKKIDPVKKASNPLPKWALVRLVRRVVK